MTMMPLRSMPFMLGIMACCLLAGCSRKKPVLVMPQEPPPAAAPTPAPKPEAKQEPPQPQASPTPAPAEAPNTATVPPNGSKPKPRSTPKKPSPATSARNNKTVVEPPADVPLNIPPPPSPEALSQQQATEQLLQTTENAIKGLTRQLSKEEQAILGQIRDFMNQSREALKVNDFVRARNAAQKAHLLSDELVKQK